MFRIAISAKVKRRAEWALCFFLKGVTKIVTNQTLRLDENENSILSSFGSFYPFYQEGHKNDQNAPRSLPKEE
jgi:hypothetical protein